MADQLLEVYDVIEREIEMINNIIKQAVINGADFGGSYDSNEENLINSINDWLEYNDLSKDYHVAKIEVEVDDNSIWQIHQIISKTNFDGVRVDVINKYIEYQGEISDLFKELDEIATEKEKDKFRKWTGYKG